MRHKSPCSRCTDLVLPIGWCTAIGARVRSAVMSHAVELASDTFLITSMAPVQPDAWLHVNTVLIRGAEPIIVDTGAPIHREEWQREVFGLVDPADVRWIFLSHDDGDHTGSLHDVLAMCRQATLVTIFFTTERRALEPALPWGRMIWRERGDPSDAGDRTIRLMLPPIFDGPTTRGLIDESTGVMW